MNAIGAIFKRYFIQMMGVVSLLISSNALAEFSCRVDISYQWKRAEAEKAEKAEKVEEVRVSGVEAKGVDEAAAKATVGQVLGREKAKALDRCRDQHENVAQCVSSKYEAAAATLQNVGFSARKAIEDAIASDCKVVQGTCQGVTASEPQCVELASAEASEGEKEGKDKEKESGKDSKKK